METKARDGKQLVNKIGKYFTKLHPSIPFMSDIPMPDDYRSEDRPRRIEKKYTRRQVCCLICLGRYRFSKRVDRMGTIIGILGSCCLIAFVLFTAWFLLVVVLGSIIGCATCCGGCADCCSGCSGCCSSE